MALLRMVTGFLFVELIALASAHAASVEPGDQLPAIAVSDAAGEAIELSFRSGDVVAVEFWASWCRACREMLPVLARLADERRGAGFRAFAVNIDHSRSAADSYLAEHLPSQRDALNISYDPGGEAMARLGPPGLPALYVVEDGTVRLVQGGWKPDGEQRLRRVVDTLLRRREQPQGDSACESSSCSR